MTATPAPGRTAPPAATRRAAAAGWGLLRFVLGRTFLDPVREGRLDGRGWPPGLRPIAACGLAVYVVVLLAAVFSSAIRGHDRLLFVVPDQTLPQVAVPLVATAMVMALSCLFTAALHLALPFRIAAVATVVAILLYPVDWSDPVPSDVVVAGLAALLPVVALVRARRRFHWGEFVVALAVIGDAVLAHQVLGLAPLARVNPGIRLSELTRLTEPVWALAAPVSVLAGAALVEITTSATTWTTTGVWSRIGAGPRARRWTAVALGGLVAARAAQEAHRIANPSAPVPVSQLVFAAALVGCVFLGCGLTARLADRAAAGDPRRRPDPDELLPAWRAVAPYLAVLLGANVGLQLLLSVLLRGFGFRRAGAAFLHLGGDNVILLTSLASTGVLGVGAIVLAVRGRRRAAVLLTAVGTMLGASSLASSVQLITTTEDLLAVATLAAVLLLIWLVVRRRLTVQSEVTIAGVLLLGVAFGYRDWLTEPLTQLVSLTGVSGALLAGLVWRILTDNGHTRGDSASFPQASRVLLALANAVIGVIFAAEVALLGGRSSLDPRQLEQVGDNLLGFPLVLAAIFTGLTLAARGREVAGRRRRRGPTEGPFLASR